MIRAIRTTLSFAVSLALFSAMTMAQAGANPAEKDKKDHSKEHSHLAKVAFWRHHKDADKAAKPAKASAPAQSKQATAKTAQVKPVSAKQSADKKDMKSEPHAGKASKVAAKKAPAANKSKSQPKATDPKPAVLKQ